MSIWVSVNDSVQALDGHRDDANYRAEGTLALEVDVATTNYHDHVRLAIWSHEANEVDVCALLSPDAVRELCRILTNAVTTATCENRQTEGTQ